MIEVRQGAKSDVDALVNMLEALNATGHEADARYQVHPDARRALRDHVVNVWFGTFSPFPACWVAVHDGALVGSLHGEPGPTHPVLATAPGARITSLWVEPSFRGQGVATRLVQTFRERATKAGFPHLEVGTLAQDTRARAFWESLGLTDYRVTLASPPEPLEASVEAPRTQRSPSEAISSARMSTIPSSKK